MSHRSKRPFPRIDLSALGPKKGGGEVTATVADAPGPPQTDIGRQASQPPPSGPPLLQPQQPQQQPQRQQRRPVIETAAGLLAALAHSSTDGWVNTSSSASSSQVISSTHLHANPRPGQSSATLPHNSSRQLAIPPNEQYPHPHPHHLRSAAKPAGYGVTMGRTMSQNSLHSFEADHNATDPATLATLKGNSASMEDLPAAMLEGGQGERRNRRPRPKPINLGQMGKAAPSTGSSSGPLGSLSSRTLPSSSDDEPRLMAGLSSLSSHHIVSASSNHSLASLTSQASSGAPPVSSSSGYASVSPSNHHQYATLQSAILNGSYVSTGDVHASPPMKRSVMAPSNPSDSPAFHLELREEDLEQLDELGMGAGGTVYKVRHRPTNTIMAKKIIHSVDETTSKEILRELQILDRCQSPYIISFYGAYENQGELCICMEFMDVGSLEKISKISGVLPEKILAVVTLSVVRGLVYLYDNFRIVHRDIKPSNILISSKGKIKLCDFGVSGIVENSVANTFVGTSAYMSPERIQGGRYSAKSDTWSLGLTLLEMALGRYPFLPARDDKAGEDEEPAVSVEQIGWVYFELLQHIVEDPIPQLPRPHEKGGGMFSNAFCDLIAVTLEKDHMKRPSPKQLLDTEFVRQAEHVQVDMPEWSRRFLEPNLNPLQVRRWSVTQKQKRESWKHMMEKRKSMRTSVLGSGPPSARQPSIIVEGIHEGMGALQLTTIPDSPPNTRRVVPGKK